MATTSFVDLKLDKERLRIFLNTPNSGDKEDLWKYLEKQKLKALVGAKRMVGVRSGDLRKNIRATHLGNLTGQYVTVGANLDYALAHHEGTRPHMITPNNGKMLRFRHGRQIVFATKVMHPGTKGNPFLRHQLIHFRG